MSTQEQYRWHSVCSADDIGEQLGVRALLGQVQIAIFRIKNEFFALDAIDPFSQAAVLSRGLVGDLKGHWVVASPLYKQHFDLRTGQCLEDESVAVKTYPVRNNAGRIEIAI